MTGEAYSLRPPRTTSRTLSRQISSRQAGTLYSSVFRGPHCQPAQPARAISPALRTLRPVAPSPLPQTPLRRSAGSSRSADNKARVHRSQYCRSVGNFKTNFLTKMPVSSELAPRTHVYFLYFLVNLPSRPSSAAATLAYGPCAPAASPELRAASA